MQEVSVACYIARSELSAASGPCATQRSPEDRDGGHEARFECRLCFGSYTPKCCSQDVANEYRACGTPVHKYTWLCLLTLPVSFLLWIYKIPKLISACCYFQLVLVSTHTENSPHLSETVSRCMTIIFHNVDEVWQWCTVFCFLTA